MEVICKICDRKFNIKPSRLKNGRGKYCSRKCYAKSISINYAREKHPNWKEKIKIICKLCGKEFFVIPGRAKSAKFCSESCRSIWIVKYGKKKDTIIEILIENELIKNRIPYIKQSPVEGIALVDFLLPNKVIIQCDGDYWHNLPKKKNRDINQDTILGFKGYKIFRFWEYEIKKSPSKCIVKVINEITQI